MLYVYIFLNQLIFITSQWNECIPCAKVFFRIGMAASLVMILVSLCPGRFPLPEWYSRRGMEIQTRSYLAFTCTHVDSAPVSAAYTRRGAGSALVQVMACRLFGGKPLPKPMLAYCQLDSQEQISERYESEFYHFHSRKCIWKCRLRNGGHFVHGWGESIQQGG